MIMMIMLTMRMGVFPGSAAVAAVRAVCAGGFRAPTVVHRHPHSRRLVLMHMVVVVLMHLLLMHLVVVLLMHVLLMC